MRFAPCKLWQLCLFGQTSGTLLVVLFGALCCRIAIAVCHTLGTYATCETASLQALGTCSPQQVSLIKIVPFSLQVVELQWKAYVDKLRESGTLSSTLSVCDVSGSMHGQPMEVRAQLCHAHGAFCYAGCIVQMWLLASCLQQISFGERPTAGC